MYNILIMSGQDYFGDEGVEICKARGKVRNKGTWVAGAFVAGGVPLYAIGRGLEGFGVGAMIVGIVVFVWTHWDNKTGIRARDELLEPWL